MMLASWLSLSLLFPVLLLLVYLATKASGRTIGIVLGAGILLTLSWGFLSQPHPPSVDWAYPIGTVLPDGTVVGESAVGESAISNKELWDQLTKSRIELDEEKTTTNTENEDKNQASGEDNFESTPAKPKWVEKPPKRMGNLYRRVVSSDPYSTAEECYLQLEGQLQNVVRERLQTLASEGTDQSVLVPDFDSFDMSLSYIMREICQDEFTETLTASFGEMKRVHVLMEFSPAVENHLRTQWKDYERRHRLSVVGIFAVAALGLLAGVYGLLQFDTWTRGYYTKRLLVGVPVVIIVAVVLLLS